ncbi:MAG TPA: guanylate kinase, partial [Nonomuraea sp.]|nr:guanylate kinase [Nonomuraea sp.]
LVRKLKMGNRRGTEYDFVSAAELDRLRAAGRLLIETHRYGNVYAIDRDHIDRLTSAGRVPIVHLGNLADVRRLVEDAPWLTVLLWVPRQICEQRSHQRGDNDTAHRLQAWDETLADLRANDDGLFHHRFFTDQAGPDEIADVIAGTFPEQRTVPFGHRA